MRGLAAATKYAQEEADELLGEEIETSTYIIRSKPCKITRNSLYLSQEAWDDVRKWAPPAMDISACSGVFPTCSG